MDGDRTARTLHLLYNAARVSPPLKEAVETVTAEVERLKRELAEARAASLDALAERVSAALPDLHEVNICIEPGAAWVTLHRDGDPIRLPDSADRTLTEQVQDAIAEIEKGAR